MNSPGPYEDTVARLWRKAGQLACDCSVLDCLPQNRCGGERPQARINASLWSLFQDHPCFGLSGITRRKKILICIGWMHLNRETLAHIEEFQQQRETTEVSRQLTQQLLRRLLQHSCDSLSLEGSIRDHAGMVVPIAQEPGFADEAARQWRGQQSAQTPAAPRPILIIRLESQRIESYILHGTFWIDSGRPPRCPPLRWRCQWSGKE